MTSGVCWVKRRSRSLREPWYSFLSISFYRMSMYFLAPGTGGLVLLGEFSLTFGDNFPLALLFLCSWKIRYSVSSNFSFRALGGKGDVEPTGGRSGESWSTNY